MFNAIWTSIREAFRETACGLLAIELQCLADHNRVVTGAKPARCFTLRQRGVDSSLRKHRRIKKPKPFL